jgi:hypothetical protein
VLNGNYPLPEVGLGALIKMSQVGPVVRLGGRATIVKASIRTQAVFKHFEILRLTTSIREADDPKFSDFLDAIGDDTINTTVDLGRLAHTQDPVECLDFVFPDKVIVDPTICINRAILSPFNEFVDEFNAAVVDRLEGTIHHYDSSDFIEGEGSEGTGEETETTLSDPDFINSLREPGVPPHTLSLKVGAVCRLTRNFDASRGLTKNTRVIIRRLFRYSVEIETLAGVVAGQAVQPVCLPSIV